MLLGYREKPSFFAVGRRLGVHHQTVQRCVERAMAYGAVAALDDRPRPGKEPTITPEAKAWLVSLACDKAKEHGYPHELWTTRLLARHARERGPAAGHQCLASLLTQLFPVHCRSLFPLPTARFGDALGEQPGQIGEISVLVDEEAKRSQSSSPGHLPVHTCRRGSSAWKCAQPSADQPQCGQRSTSQPSRCHSIGRFW